MHAAGVAVVADAETEVDAVRVVAEVEQDVPQRQRVLAAGDGDQHLLVAAEHPVLVDRPAGLLAAVAQEALGAERRVVASYVDDGGRAAALAPGHAGSFMRRRR